MLELKLHGKLAAAPQSPADLGRRLALHEAPRPGGETAVTAEAIELGQDRDHCVIGSLDGKIVEIAAGRVGERRRSSTDLEPGLTTEKRVEATNRIVTARPARLKRFNPGLRFRIEAPGARALCPAARLDDEIDRGRRPSARNGLAVSVGDAGPHLVGVVPSARKGALRRGCSAGVTGTARRLVSIAGADIACAPSVG